MRNLSVAILLLAAAAALPAQQPRFGVQGALSVPVSDLTDYAGTGVLLGGHAQWDFHGGHGLLALADAAFYTSHDGSSVNGLQGAADYTYHVEREPSGLFLLAGLSLAKYRTTYSNSSYNFGNTNLGVDLGGGYDLDRNLGVLVRYTTHHSDAMGPNASPNPLEHLSRTYAALNLGVTYTF
jgi:hypothetical protein